MSEMNDPLGWASWLEQAQKTWEQTQQAVRGQQNPWSGLWPSMAPSAAFGTMPNLVTAMQELMASVGKSTAGVAAPEAMAQINAIFQPLLTQVLQAQQPITAFWKQVMDDSSSAFGGMGGLPGMNGAVPGLDVAPLGAAREYIRQMQAYQAESAELPEKLQAYQAALAEFPERLKGHLEAGALALEKEGKTLDSAREVFDFWVDAAELAFAEIAHGRAYGKAQGELSNLLMQLKIGRQQMLDHAVEFIGLPSRRELDTTHRRMTALRRENRELKRALEELRADVASLQAARRTAPSRSKATTAKTTKKDEETRA